MESPYSGLIPEAARGLPVRGGAGGVTQSPPARVELRRWHRPFVPLDYQTEIIAGIERLLLQGSVTGLLSLPTGSGKTVTAARALLDALNSLDSSSRSPVALWLAPQVELLQQAMQGLQAAWWSGIGPATLDLLLLQQSAIPAIVRPSVFLCTAARAQRIADFSGANCTCVVFDEAHHVAGNVFEKVWTSARQLVREKHGLALGLSATPLRSIRDEQSMLVRAFDSCLLVPRSLYPKPVESLFGRGVLAKPRFEEVPCEVEHARGRVRGDRRTIEQLSRDRDRWDALIAYAMKASEKTIVFAPNRKFGEAFCRHLRFLGKSAEYVDGDAAFVERQGVFERFSGTQTQVVVNVSLFVEGVDCPAAEKVLLTYPVGTRIRLAQMIGRVLRGPAMGGTASACVAALEGSQAMVDSIIEVRPYQLSSWQNLTILE